MPVYTIDTNNRTVRVFDSLEAARRASRAGEEVFFQSAGPAGAGEHREEDLVATVREVLRNGPAHHAIAADDVRVEVSGLPDLFAPKPSPAPKLPEPLTGLVNLLTERHQAVIARVREVLAKLESYTELAQTEQAAAEGVERLMADVRSRYRQRVAEARARLASAATPLETARVRREIADLAIGELEELEALNGVHGGPGPATLRRQAAERELTALASRLRQTSKGDLDSAERVAGRVAELEAEEADTLVDVREPRRRKRAARPHQGRKPGERRGRRSEREGKVFRFAPGVTANPAKRNTRRFRSFQLVMDNPGIGYEKFLERGGDPADIGVGLASGVLVAEG